MTSNERLLLKLSEEAAEVIQATTKCLRFGTYTFNPKTQKSNILALQTEVMDLIYTLQKLGMNYSLSKEQFEEREKQYAKWERFNETGRES